MRIAVLTAEDPPQPGVAEILRAHRQAGHDADVVHLGQVILRAGSVPRLPGARPAVAHSRASAMWAIEAQAQLEAAGLLIVNSVSGQRAGRDKWACATALATAGVPAVPTVLAVPGTAARDVADELGTDNLVVKPLDRYGGEGLARCRGTAQLGAALRAAGGPRVVQPYVEARGASRRDVVIGRVVVASVTMRAADGEWRSNLALGAAVSPALPDRETENRAVAAAAATGLEIAAVDTIAGRVAEVNTNAGLKSGAVAGVDLAALMAAYVQSRAYR